MLRVNELKSIVYVLRLERISFMKRICYSFAILLCSGKPAGLLRRWRPNGRVDERSVVLVALEVRVSLDLATAVVSHGATCSSLALILNGRE